MQAASRISGTCCLFKLNQGELQFTCGTMPRISSSRPYTSTKEYAAGTPMPSRKFESTSGLLSNAGHL